MQHALWALHRQVGALRTASAVAAWLCRTFGIKRSTLIDFLARIGWSAGPKGQES